MGKLLIIVGIILVLIGLFLTYVPKVPFLGRLPGDISIERENFRLYIPITSGIIVSIVLSLLLYLINRFRN
jgi:hypothetical protein